MCDLEQFHKIGSQMFLIVFQLKYPIRPRMKIKRYLQFIFYFLYTGSFYPVIFSRTYFVQIDFVPPAIISTLLITYSTAQLQGNVQTRLKRVQDVSGTHTRRVHASANPRDKAATRRMWVPRPFSPDGSVSGTHVRRVWNMCECYLGAELYCKAKNLTDPWFYPLDNEEVIKNIWRKNTD